MILFTCTNCGANDCYEQNGYRICCYCETKYAIQAEDVLLKVTNISLDDDVSRLLIKCKTDPVNARKYASLALDIDPSNEEANNILNSSNDRRRRK